MRGIDQKKFSAMRKAGAISSHALKEVLAAIKPGVSLLELDRIAEEQIIARGAIPAFKRVDNYPFTTCINVNEGLVHGLPTEYALKVGDVVSVDVGAYFDGYNSDQCWTVEVETDINSKFLAVGKTALEEAIKAATPGNRMGDISSAIERVVVSAGYSVSYDLVGHGISKKVHERPNVPCFGDPGTGPSLKEFQTLAVEVIYSKGSSEIVMAEDSWTIETLDKSLAAVFEHTIGIKDPEPEVFTKF